MKKVILAGLFFCSSVSANEFNALAAYMDSGKNEEVLTGISLLPNASSYYTSENVDGVEYRITYQRLEAQKVQDVSVFSGDAPSTTEVCVTVKVDGSTWEVCARKLD
ncbi:hypothetical protein [Ferrimonas aestuarii]|uniref:Uncharacterized protein n=1 Tax=Ferrimonas aestuarii TaxID=2569539 RepID=A0A4U1BSC1_9GAMM|nr:hypothetical protein [Ferrimonas aestuarii]TKB56527.1 hypothetical protein FCL42_05180 [Ferrimonas aestuarii]